MKQGFLDKLVDRLDRMDPGSLQTHFLHLAREKGFLEAVFNALQEGIVVLEEGGRIAYANRAAEKMIGFRADQSLGHPIRRYLRDIQWESLLRLDESEWSKLVNREIEVTYPEHRFLVFYVVPLVLGGEDRGGAVLILRDVTRDREREAYTLESERLNALTLLSAGVAHELGNPLNALTIHLQLLVRELRDLPPEQRTSLESLAEIPLKEVARLDRIINQFLRAIRPTQPDLRPAALADVVRETIEFMRHEIEDRDVIVEIEDPGDLPPVQVDAGMVRQAFFNVVRNAVQAMADGGLLKVGFAATDRFVSVSFRDTGPGIQPEDLGRLFEAHQTTKSEGSGLGLMIVQRIVRDHGGEIEVDSEPGSGTTFTLFFLRHQPRMRLLTAPEPPPEKEGGPRP